MIKGGGGGRGGGGGGGGGGRGGGKYGDNYAKLCLFLATNVTSEYKSLNYCIKHSSINTGSSVWCSTGMAVLIQETQYS